jgi:hypothetical protein
MTAALDALLGQVDAARMSATVDRLAGDDFAGRRAGSPGGAAARGWLRDQLAGLSADVAIDPFEVRSVPVVHAAPEVTWHDWAAEHRLTFGRQIIPHLASADLSRPRPGDLAIPGAGDPATLSSLIGDKR